MNKAALIAVSGLRISWATPAASMPSEASFSLRSAKARLSPSLTWSGAIIWRRQLIQGDNDLSGCAPHRNLFNCPTTLGHDYDFGASPVLLTLPSGKDVLLAGQKSGGVYAMDPDKDGKLLWQAREPPKH